MKKLVAIAITLFLTAGLALAEGGTAADQTAQAKKKSSKTSSAESKVALNPQPLPPVAKGKTASSADKVSLNPQPLPPKERKAGGTAESKVALNPQPLPPGQAKGKTSAESKVALNPQPLPPGGHSSAKKKSAADGKKVSVPAGASRPKQ